MRSLATMIGPTTAVLALASSTFAQVAFDTRALSDDPATGSGGVFTYFGFPVINDLGQTAFLGGASTLSGSGIWVEDSVATSPIVLPGDSAPDMDGNDLGVSFSSASTPRLNNLGQTAFGSLLTGPGVTAANDRGIWSQGSGSLRLVAREGDAAPGAGAGVTFSAFDSQSPLFNDAGQTAFLADTSTAESGIWIKSSGALNLIALEGTAAEGTGPGVVYSGIFSPEFNEAGQVAFRSNLSGTDVVPANNVGIWRGSAAALDLVVREGDAAPGIPGAAYSSMSNPALNDSGQVGFVGHVVGGGTTSADNTGIWRGTPGSLDMFVRAGDAAAGTQPGVAYDLFLNPQLNNAGQMSFFGRLAGPGVDATNDFGVWAGDSGSLAMIMREGDAAPGTGPDIVFSDLDLPIDYSYVLSESGQVAFKGFVDGPGITNANDQGIWATLPNGSLALIAREGELFDVDDDPLIEDLRTIATVNFFSNLLDADVKHGSFNAAGELVFYLAFTDGSQGIFVATVPEPQAYVLAAMAMVGFLASARRRKR